MKTLHASAIAKLVARKKAKDAADLLTLVGPDTDVMLLLQELITLQEAAVVNRHHKWYNCISTLRDMTVSLFRAACLHYPDQAEEFLRKVDSEYVLRALLGENGNGFSVVGRILAHAYKAHKAIVEPGVKQDEKEDDDDDEVDSIITAERDKLLGRVAHEK